MRLQLLHFQIPFANIVGALRAHLLNRTLHALDLFFESSDRSFGAGKVGLQ
jgi:hypothetical protein